MVNNEFCHCLQVLSTLRACQNILNPMQLSVMVVHPLKYWSDLSLRSTRKIVFLIICCKILGSPQAVSFDFCSFSKFWLTQREKGRIWLYFCSSFWLFTFASYISLYVWTQCCEGQMLIVWSICGRLASKWNWYPYMDIALWQLNFALSYRHSDICLGYFALCSFFCLASLRHRNFYFLSFVLPIPSVFSKFRFAPLFSSSLFSSICLLSPTTCSIAVM